MQPLTSTYNEVEAHRGKEKKDVVVGGWMDDGGKRALLFISGRVAYLGWRAMMPTTTTGDDLK